MTATYQARPSAPPLAARPPISTGSGGTDSRGPAQHRTTGRRLHPWAWWAWALCVAAAVSLTTNPLLVVLCAGAVVTVALVKRSDDVWARSIAAYLYLAAAIIVVRLLFQVVLGADRPGTVLFTLPEVSLPGWAAGIRLGGPVRAEFLLISLYDALRLATMLLCVGAANALANPRRALRSVPSALYEVSVAVVIALTVAPQLVVSAVKARRARRLRGSTAKGLRAVRALLIPVLEDAVEQSMALAAGMESRGFGRTRRDGRRVVVSATVLLALMLLAFGVFMLLGSHGLVAPPWLPAWTGQAALLAGAGLAAGGFWLSGRSLRTTRYRPDPWLAPETLVCLCGLGGFVVMIWLAGNLPFWPSPLRRAWLAPPVEPLAVPQLHPVMLLPPALAVLPLFLAPRPPASVLRYAATPSSEETHD